MEETNKDLETQTDANESVEKIETVEETTKEETMEKTGIRQIIKTKRTVLNWEKLLFRD